MDDSTGSIRIYPSDIDALAEGPELSFRDPEVNRRSLIR
jgi:hypothetical protein